MKKNNSKIKLLNSYKLNIIFIFTLVMFIGLSLLQAVPVEAQEEPKTWYVNASVSESGDGESLETAFKTIGEGVTAASADDTINVAAGTYTEQVVINTSLTLQGAGADVTTITYTTTTDGGYVVSLQSCSGVKLSGFKIICDGKGGSTKADGGISLKNTTQSQLINLVVSGSTTSNGFLGISLNASSYNELDSVTIQGVSSNANSEGIILSNGSSNNSLNNITVNNLTGDYAWGIEVNGSNNNTFETVEISDLKATSAAGQSEGIYIREANRNSFTDVQINSITTESGFNISYGLHLQIANENNFTSVTIDNISAPITPAGISLMSGASNNIFTDVDVSNIEDTGMGQEGYDIGVALGVSISNNTSTSPATGNEFNDISITNIIGDLSSTSNGARGFYLTQYSNGNVFSDYSISELSGATTIGVFISAGDNNLFSNGSVTGATRGIQVQSSGTDEAEGTSVHFTNIAGNTEYGVRNANTTAVVDATQNWWGDASGPKHITSWEYEEVTVTNPDGTGDAVSNNVLYYPWYTDVNLETLSNFITLTKTGPDNAEQGDVITYMIEYKNEGNFTETNVVITEDYPEEVEFLSSSLDPDDGTNNKWTIGDLDPEAGDTITITVLIK